MKTPTNLKAMDVLAYKSEDAGWISRAITWGQWRGANNSPEYSHIGLVHNPAMNSACEMNPPFSKLINLDDEFANRQIDVYRVRIAGQDVADNPKILFAFWEDVKKNLGEAYNYGRIGRFLAFNMIARAGLPSVTDFLLKHDALAISHFEVCSTWAEERLTHAVQTVYNGWDMFPKIGEESVTPADYPSSPFVYRLALNIPA